MKLFLYMLHWQASTPILFVAINFLPYDNITKTIVANILGSIIFYPIDKLIFRKRGNK